MGLLSSQSVGVQGAATGLAKPHHLALQGLVVDSQIAVADESGLQTITEESVREVTITGLGLTAERTETDDSALQSSETRTAKSLVAERTETEDP